MKLVTLNIWGGRLSETHKEFFQKYTDIDIWCFQETFHGASPSYKSNVPGFTPDYNLHNNLKNFLPDLHDEFCQTRRGFHGISAFLSKDVELIEKGEILIAKGNFDEVEGKEQDWHRKLQWLEVRIEGKKALIMNAHFTHRPEGKQDDEKRIKQSKIIVEFMSMFDYPKILVGDFNLLPGTESIKMLERTGMRNLIIEHSITSTRTEFYKKELRYADYVLVSPEIIVNEFKVLPDVVSDHSPLFLDFKIN